MRRARLRAGRRRRDGPQLPDASPPCAPATATRPTCTTSRSRPATSPTSPPTTSMRCDLSSVGGARNGVMIDTVVQQVDMKTGLVRWEWHSLDHVAAGESHAPVPTTAIPWDSFHLNSIDVEPDGDLLISARSTWAAYQLAGRLGGDPLAARRHEQQLHDGPRAPKRRGSTTRALQPDGTVTMFDDGSNPRVHYQSRGRARGDRHDTPHRSPAGRLPAPRRAAAGRQPGQHADAARRQPA